VAGIFEVKEMAHITRNPRSFSPLGMGCWQYHPGLWNADQNHALIETLAAALAHGTDHFDTATGCGDGASEELVGRFLQGRREQVFVATKAGIQDENPHTMLESVRRSLERLNTDSYQLCGHLFHRPLCYLERPGIQSPTPVLSRRIDPL
jgi:aryl-alcohol dehydrogenase-like predicted oxidoreductase